MNLGDKVAQMRAGGKSEHEATKSAIKTIQPKKKGQKKISFHEGGLHASTGTAPGQPISAAKHEEAKEGKLGPKAAKQEAFFENVLGGRK